MERVSRADQKIAMRLRARRLLLGLSLEALATEIQLSPQQVHKYETGQSRVSAGRLAQLAHILDVPISYFFEDLIAQRDLPNDLTRFLSDPKYAEVLVLFGRLPDRAQNGVIELLRNLDKQNYVSSDNLERQEPQRSVG